MVSADSCLFQDMIETINNAESVIHDIESKMDEFKDQLPETEVSSGTVIMVLLHSSLLAWLKPLCFASHLFLSWFR